MRAAPRVPGPAGAEISGEADAAGRVPGLAGKAKPKRRRRRRQLAPKRPVAPTEISRGIAKLAPEGFHAGEIGERLEIPKRTVTRLAKRHGIELSAVLARGMRRLPAAVRAADLPALDAVAAAAAVSRAEIIRRLLAIALEDGGKPALRLLGKLAQPKRAWVRREPVEAAERLSRAQE